MDMSDHACGTLRLLEVPEGCEERVVDFLVRFYKNTPRERLVTLIAAPPVTLSRQVPRTVAHRILTQLTDLGATGQFVLPQAGRPPQNRQTPPCDRPAPQSAQPRVASQTERLAAAFRQEQLRFPVPLHYRLGLLVVSVAMVLLPLLYVAMIAGVGYWTFWHATVNLRLFHTVRSVRLALFCYAGPLMIGGLLFFFMIKPLFARRQEFWKQVEVSPRAEPVLRDFIQRICQSVGAPQPALIRFDNQINASASFRRGLASFFSHDLVLTIGLPLAGGLTLSEFAGVLAHEFGHFAQSSGMRLTYLVRSVNGWFARVVYEEDAWDARLRQWSREIDFRIGIILHLARFFIWLTRRVLWVLMQLGNVISCFMLRQMEFDADRYEAGLVGADTFAATSDKLPLLSVAHAQAFEDINQAWKEGRLADNLTALVRLKFEQIDEQSRHAILKRQSSATTGLFDSHPAASERIASAAKVDAGPVLCWPHKTMPETRILFRDFDALAKQVTLEHYRACLGRAPDRKSLVDVAAMAASQALEKRFTDVLDAYFLSAFTPWRSLRLDKFVPRVASDPKADLERLKTVRQQLLRTSAQHADNLEKHFVLKDRLLKAARADSLLEAGFTIKAQSFALTKGTKQGVEMAERRCREQLSALEKDLHRAEALYRERLQLAMGLLQVPAVRKRLGEGVVADEKTADYYRALAALQEQLPTVAGIQSDLTRLDILVRHLEGHEKDEQLINTIRWKMEDLRTALEELGQKLATEAYPFEHSREGLNLGSYLVRAVPGTDDLQSCFDAAGETLNNALELSTRLAGRLAETATRVEMALSLPRLSVAKGRAEQTSER